MAEDQSYQYHNTNQKSPSRTRLTKTFFLAAFISIALAEICWLLPAMLNQEKKIFEELERRARVAVKAMIEESRFDDVALTETIGKRLMDIGDIKGATIYDRQGNRINSFGQTPTLSWIGAVKEGTAKYIAPDHCCLDIHLAPADTKLADHLILRLDMSEARKSLSGYIWELAWTIFIVAFITCIGVVTQLYFWIAHPIKQLSVAAVQAAANPALADNFQNKLSRGDEMGELAKSMNKLFRTIGHLYRNEFQVARQLLTKAQHAVLQFSPNAELIAINRAGLTLFSVQSLEELKKEPQDFFRIPGRNEGKSTPVTGIISEQGLLECGFVKTKSGPYRCVFSTTTVKKQDGEIDQHVVVIMLTDRHSKDFLTLEDDLAQTKTQLLFMKKRSADMILQNETARTFAQTVQLGEADTKEKTQAGNFDCYTTLTNWYDKVKNYNLKIDLDISRDIPLLFGYKKHLTTLFEQAISMVYLRSEFNEPLITITAELNSKQDHANIIITDISKRLGRTYLPQSQARENWEIPLATIERLVSQTPSQIISGKTGGLANNELVISVPLAKQQKEKAA